MNICRFVSLYPEQIEEISWIAFEDCLEEFKDDLLPLDHTGRLRDYGEDLGSIRILFRKLNFYTKLLTVVM